VLIFQLKKYRYRAKVPTHRAQKTPEVAEAGTAESHYYKLKSR
jgi:hypothetical protein